jgi:hypothetical protein
MYSSRNDETQIGNGIQTGARRLNEVTKIKRD